MQRIYEAANRIEAQFLVDYLDRYLISAVVFGDYLSGAIGELPVIYPTVWILEDTDLERAEALLARFLLEQSRKVAESTWICPNCHERVEGGFDLCWNCGQSRD